LARAKTLRGATLPDGTIYGEPAASQAAEATTGQTAPVPAEPEPQDAEGQPEPADGEDATTHDQETPDAP
jgi:hypothetical protein